MDQMDQRENKFLTFFFCYAIFFFAVQAYLFVNSSRVSRVPASESLEGASCLDLGSQLALDEEVMTPLRLEKVIGKIVDGKEGNAHQVKFFQIQSQKILDEMELDHQRMVELRNKNEQLTRPEKKELAEITNRIHESIPLDDWKEIVEELQVRDLGSVMDDFQLDPDDVVATFQYIDLPKDPLKTRFLNMLWKEKFTLSPAILLPLAAVAFDGGLTAAIFGGIKLSAGIKGMDLALDKIIDNADKILTPNQMAFTVAASGNLVELGSSLYPAIAKDVLVADAGAIPLGSNIANPILGVAAFISVVRNVARHQGILKRGQKMTPRLFLRTVKDAWPIVRKESMYALSFMTSAVLFQTVVRPQMMAGNYLPLAGWLTVNVPAMVWYFGRGIIQSKRAFKETITEFSEEGIESVRRQLEFHPEEYARSKEKFNELLDKLATAKASAGGRLSRKDVKNHLLAIQTEMANSENFKAEVEGMLHTLKDSELETLFRIAGVTATEGATMSRSEKLKAVTWIIAGMSAVLAMSVVLDSGVEDMAEAWPDLGKTWLGFFVMSFFSSLPELMGTQKLLSVGNTQGGAQNISDSNALNLIIAKISMGAAYFRGVAEELEKNSTEP